MPDIFVTLRLATELGPMLIDSFRIVPNPRNSLDAYNNVPHVGHCHPQVVEAVTDQMGRINSNTRYMHANPVMYARRLTDLMPSSE